MNIWRRVRKEDLPHEGEVVDTKIDDAQGLRLEQRLKWMLRRWFHPDDGMYVYYTPTHWRPIL